MHPRTFVLQQARWRRTGAGNHRSWPNTRLGNDVSVGAARPERQTLEKKFITWPPPDGPAALSRDALLLRGGCSSYRRVFLHPLAAASPPLQTRYYYRSHNVPITRYQSRSALSQPGALQTCTIPLECLLDF
jgi:hypothetical protein